MHLGDTEIDQWSTSPVGYRATRFTATPAASIESSTPVPSSKTTPAAPAASNTSQLRIFIKYATHETFYSTQIDPVNPSTTSSLSASTYQLITSTKHPTALGQYPSSSYLSSYNLSSTVQHTSLSTAPSTQLPNSFTQ